MSPGNAAAPGGGPGDGESWDREPTTKVTRTYDTSEQAEPYRAAWRTYWDNGWRGVLPLPAGRKNDPPTGYTGRAGVDPSYADCQAWADDRPDANLGLRLPPDVIGLDVDTWDDKPGEHTLAALTTSWGPLPFTWRSTSRGHDQPSCIRLFRIPAGVELRDSLPGIDVIQRHHRYVVGWPSIHPNGGTYQWMDERTGEVGGVPSLDEVPDLPQVWLDGLRTEGQPHERADVGNVQAVLDGMPEGEQCDHVRRAASKVFDSDGRHDGYRDAVLAVVGAGRRGCPGAPDALRRMRRTFLGDVTAGGQDPAHKRTRQEAQREWDSLLQGAVGIAVGEHPEQGAHCIEDVPAWVSDPAGETSLQTSRVTESANTAKSAKSGPKLWLANDLKPGAPTRWLVRRHLPQGQVAVLVGDEGIGKSLWWVLIAAHVTTGRALPELGIPARAPRDVLLVITEDSWTGEVRHRLDVAGVDMNRVIVVADDEDGSGAPEFPRDMHLVTAAARDRDVALVVVDAWLDTVSTNRQVKDPQQARAALHPWREAATVTGAAVLLLAHSNRSDVGSLRDRVGATGALRQKARVLLYAAQPPNAPGVMYLGPDKANGTAKGNAVAYRVKVIQVRPATDDDEGTVGMLEVTGPTDATMEGHYAAWRMEARRQAHPKADDQVWAWLLRYITDHGESSEHGLQVVAAAAKKAARASGHNPQRLAPLVREHGGQVLPAGPGKPWVYRMPDLVSPSGGSTNSEHSLVSGEVQTSQTSQTSQTPEHGKSAAKSPPDSCDTCGNPLLLTAPGRTTCAYCQARTPERTHA